MLQYLYSSKDFVIIYSYSSQNPTRNKPELGLKAFLDTSFAMIYSRHLQSSFVCLVASSPILWYLAKQLIIILSSTKAKYIRLVIAIQSILSVSNLLLELGYHRKDKILFQVLGDNINTFGTIDNSRVIWSIKYLELQ